MPGINRRRASALIVFLALLASGARSVRAQAEGLTMTAEAGLDGAGQYRAIRSYLEQRVRA